MNIYDNIKIYLREQLNIIENLINDETLKYRDKANLDAIIRQLDVYNFKNLRNTSIINQTISTLKNITDIEEAEWIGNRLQEFFKYADFINSDNPIILDIIFEFNNLKSRLAQISNNISIFKNMDSLKEQKEKLEYLIDNITENGFKTIFTSEMQEELFNYIKKSNLDIEDKYTLIKSYLNYYLEQLEKEEEKSIEKDIQILEDNTDKVINELKKVAEENDQINNIPQGYNPLRQQQEEILDKINKLMEMHSKELDAKSYKEYTEKFSKLEIFDIFIARGNFFIDGNIDWKKTIPCIKEKLLKEIDGPDKIQILSLLQQFVATSEKELDKYEDFVKEKNDEKERIKKEKQEAKKIKEEEERKKREEEEKERLKQEEFEQIKSKYLEILETVEELFTKVKEKSKFIERTINSIGTNLSQEKSSLFADRIVDRKKGKDIDNNYLKTLGLTVEELDSYLKIVDIENNIKALKLLIEEQTTTEIVSDLTKDLSKIKEELNELNTKIDEIIKTKENVQAPPEVKQKQYLSGNSIIVFFRKDEESKFLVEEDMDKQQVDKESYNDIEQILITTNETKAQEWGNINKKHKGFKNPIDKNKESGKRGTPVTLKSDFSGEEYEFFRLKHVMATKPRLTAFDIKMCEENYQKLDIPSDKHVILIVGEKQVEKYSNERAEYGDMRRELSHYEGLVKEYIKLFEDPSTPVEVLYKILDDSSDLYDKLTQNDRGLGGI